MKSISILVLCLGFVFLANGQELWPGDKIWEFETGNGVSTPAIGVDGTVYIGADKIYALNGKTGENKWVFETGNFLNPGTPSIGNDGTVFVGVENKVYALDGQSGDKKWEFKIGEWDFFQPPRGSVAIGSNGIVYFGVEGDEKIYGLDAKTGDKKWESEALGWVSSSPVIGLDGTIYVTFTTDPFFSGGSAAWTNNLSALDGNTGVKKWSFSEKNPGGAYFFTSPAIGGDGTVYVGADKVYALDGKTGNKIRSLFTREWVSSPPAIGGDGTVYVGSDDKNVYAFDGQSGAKQWEFKTGGWVYSSPAIGADGTVYVGSDDKNVYAFDGQSGAKQWEFKTGGFVTSSPAIGSDGTLYVGSNDKKVYAIKTSSTGPADSPWPMFGANAQRTGRVQSQKTHEPQNTAPTGLSLSTSSIDENQTAATVVGTFSTIDSDTNDAHSYTLISGTGDTDNASFTIDGSSLKTAATFDFEIKSSYSILVQSADAAGATFAKVFTITVTDLAEDTTPPSITLLDKSWERSIGTKSDDKLVNLILDGNGTLHLGGGWGSDSQPPFSYDLRFMQTDVNGINPKLVPVAAAWASWDSSFVEKDEFLVKLFLKDNGNYIITGTSNEMIETNVQLDMKSPHILMFEYDNNNKEIIWKEHLGGIGRDLLNVSLQTTDGNYVLGSQSYSRTSGEKTEDAFGYTWNGLAGANAGGAKEPEYTCDYWILKVSGDGGVIWQKAFGGSKNDEVKSIIETSDGGFIIAGHSNSPISSGDVNHYWIVDGVESNELLDTIPSGNKESKNHGGYDFYIVKIDKDGEKIWDKSYGGSNDDYLYFIHKAIDGGYLLGGISYSGKSGNKTTNNYGLNDYWVIKVDIDGTKIWEKSFGGDGRDWLSSITKIGQEGYLLAGNSNSNLSGSKKAQNHGGYDFWAIKISKYGDYIWDNTYGGNKDDIIGGYPTVGGVGVIPYFDGFILAGDSRSETDTGTKSSKQFSTDDQRDYWMVKIDSSGEQNFDLSFGGNGDEIFHSIVETPDHGLILGGISNSEQSGNKTEKKKGGFDIWILRLDPVIAPALITEIPDQTMNQGDELILQLEVSGTRPIVVRWFKNDVVLPEYTELQLKISKTQLTDSGVYRAEISNSVGQISSDEIKVKIVGIAPTITYFRAHGIQNVNVYKGEDAIVEVIALGTLPLEYKWFFNGKLLEKHDSKLTINEAGDDDVGVYRVEVSNDYGLTAIKEAAFKFSKRIKPPQTRIKIDPDNRDKVIFEFHAHEKGLWIIESSSDLTIWNEKAGVIVGYKSGTQQAEKLLQLAKQNMRTRGWSIVFNNPTNMGRWIEPLKDRIQFYRLKKLQ